jgi:uncharacterized protein (DUF3820 family)
MKNKKVKFGKYKGLSLAQIAKIDRDYIVWLSKNTKDADLYIKLHKLL